MRVIVALLVVLAFSSLSIKAAFIVYNHMDIPINVLVGTGWGSVKLSDIDPNGMQASNTIQKVNLDKIKVYYAQDKDFKYHFISTEPTSFGKKILEPFNVKNLRSIGIYNDKITVDIPKSNEVNAPVTTKTVCSPCKTDSGALDKVKKHYNIS